MTKRSRFDELHDRFQSYRTTKAGTRYERLAAVVLKSLNERETVIHDLELLGESEVKHQIDVTIEADGKIRRLLVECKDFDVSGDPVGLPIVRNFFGVVEDTKPDESLIITCNGFTDDARTYARAKGIRLAVLRTPHEDDWRRAPRAIEGTVVLRVPTLLACTLIFHGDEQVLAPKLAADRAAAGLHPTVTNHHDPVFFNNTEDGRVQYCHYLSKHLNALAKDLDGVTDVTVSLRGMALEIEQRGGLPLESMTLKIQIQEMGKSVIRVAADTIASLILEDIAESEHVVWEHDLQRFAINDDGTVMALTEE